MSTEETQQTKDVETSDDYPDVLMEGHSYDGIKEYDNPMPGWWKWLFVVTIIWSVIYVAAISLGYISSYDEQLDSSLEEIEAKRQAAEAKSPPVDKALLEEKAGSEAAVSAGESVYMTNCANCHGQKGEGGIGPNLTDKYWLHGGGIEDVYNTIKTGVSDKGMPSWQGMLSRDDLLAVTAYVQKLRTTDPKGGKKPQGEPYEPDSK